MPNEPLQGVLARLDTVIDKARKTRDRRGFFAALYRRVTREVADRIRNGRFDRPEDVARLDIRFASRYFDAVDSLQTGGRTSRSWRVAFDAAGNDRMLIVQHLLLGMNAHINFDLGIATADVFASGEQLRAAKADFEAVNDVFRVMLDDVEDRIGNLSPNFGMLDELAGGADEAVAGFSIRHARERAWSNAEALVAFGSLGRAFLTGMQDGLVASFGQALRSPLITAALEPIRQAESHDIPAIIDALAGD